MSESTETQEESPVSTPEPSKRSSKLKKVAVGIAAGVALMGAPKAVESVKNVAIERGIINRNADIEELLSVGSWDKYSGKEIGTKGYLKYFRTFTTKSDHIYVEYMLFREKPLLGS